MDERTRRAAPLFPTGKRMDLREPEKAEFFDPAQVAFLVKEVGSYHKTPMRRIFTSFGEGRSWGVGTEHDIKHDQTLRFLGRFRVLGIVRFSLLATGPARSHEGWTSSDRALGHWVFK